MDTTRWHPDAAPESDEPERVETPEERVDQFGMNLSLAILGVALLFAGLWVVSRPSFEKCRALADATARNVCYEQLRGELMKLPARGADSGADASAQIPRFQKS